MFKGLRASPDYFSESWNRRRSEGIAPGPERLAHGGVPGATGRKFTVS